MSNPNLPGLDIEGCHIIGSDVMFVREVLDKYELEHGLTEQIERWKKTEWRDL